MEALPPRHSAVDGETSDLKSLLDAFGTMLSIDVIASAYLEADRSAGRAAEILYEKRSMFSEIDRVSEYGLETVEEGSNTSSFPKPTYRNLKNAKPKKCVSSMGMVSSVIGKSYDQPKRSTLKGCPLPLNLDERETPKTLITVDPFSTSIEDDRKPQDTEQFMIDMLRDVFQLETSVVREVLEHCGYDVNQSMEKLLHLSATQTEKRNEEDEGSVWVENSDSGQPEEHLDSLISVSRMDKFDLQREVLESLFCVPSRLKERPKTLPLRKIRSKAFGPPVLAPLDETFSESVYETDAAEQVPIIESDEDDNSFKGLRKAVKEYWTMMKEYCRAAIEAHAAGEHEKAYKLMKEGYFYSKKAREADDRSSQKVLEGKKCTENETVVLDLSEQGRKEAVSLLELHLSTLCGIPTMEYLKLKLWSAGPKAGSRKRSITSLLERESIGWTEDENGMVLLIQVNKINPKSFTFANKT